jgi:hypothetical protein
VNLHVTDVRVRIRRTLADRREGPVQHKYLQLLHPPLACHLPLPFRHGRSSPSFSTSSGWVLASRSQEVHWRWIFSDSTFEAPPIHCPILLLFVSACSIPVLAVERLRQLLPFGRAHCKKRLHQIVLIEGCSISTCSSSRGV